MKKDELLKKLSKIADEHAKEFGIEHNSSSEIESWGDYSKEIVISQMGEKVCLHYGCISNKNYYCGLLVFTPNREGNYLFTKASTHVNGELDKKDAFSDKLFDSFELSIVEMFGEE